MREACKKMPPWTPKHLKMESVATAAPRGDSSSQRGVEVVTSAPMRELLEGLREAVALLYNVTGKAACFALDPSGPAAGNVGPWGE